MHPLDGAYERVRRADIHLADLDAQVRILSKAISDGIVVYAQPRSRYEAGDVVGAFKVTLPQVPHIVSILVGETVYNLRSALDYLVYELARYDSASIQDNTQFPIEDTQQVFRGRHRHFIKGLSDEHVASIERLQPYNGCDWTKLIRDLSNPDKHRTLTITKTSCQYVIRIPHGGTEAISPDPSVFNHPVNMNNSATIHVKFCAGSLIVDVDTLKQLKVQVAETLDAFHPEFK